MCGIAGFYSNDSRWGRADLKRMTDSIKHRGPDAEGHFLHEGFGLGHRRLSIIDLSEASNQPFTSADGRYVMTYNGEVYNFKEVAAKLKIQTKTTSDTEVIIEAFAQKGPSFVEMLNGMFVMAILDKAENKLFIFRDRLGIKPLYYSLEKGSLLFGSELKVVTEMLQKTTINSEAVAKFLHMGYIPEPISIFNEVAKFPAGSYGVLEGGKMNITQYWNPADKVGTEVITDEKTGVDQLENLLKDSVDKRLMSDVPFGTFLSGGIDSSTVTALAQASRDQKINTFSIGSSDAGHDESEFARAVAKHLGTEHHEYTVTENDALELIPTLLDSYDEPYADSSAVPTMLVSKMARQEVTMTLSGDGGDELFMGYGAYAWAYRLSKEPFKTFRKPIAGLLSLGNDHKKRGGKVFNWSREDHIPSHIFSQEQNLFSEAEVEKLMVNPSAAAPEDQLVKTARNLDPAERQAFYDLRYYLKDDLLTKVDRASMKYSLETRVPILDHRIVEFALNVSPSLKMKGGEMKHLLKQVLYRHVPKEIFDRPKKGFSIPLVRWLKTDLAYLIDTYLTEEKILEAGLVNWSVVEGLKSGFRSGQDHLYNRLWLLIILHQWFEKSVKK